MAGLMDAANQPQEQAQEQPPVERDPATLTDGADEGGEAATPEEQAQYEQATENLLSLIYEEKDLRPGLLEAFQIEGEPPAEGNAPKPHVLALANTAVEITKTVDDSAREAGQTLTNDVLKEIALDSVEYLVEAVEAAGVQEYSEDDMGGAIALFVDMYRPKIIEDGRATEEELKAEWDGLLEADKAGSLKEFTGQDIK